MPVRPASARLPQWDLFMDRIYRVIRPGEPALQVVSCACGETGEAKDLGWTGQRCAACHDRREEGQPHPDDGTPVVFPGPTAGLHLAFSPDGGALVVSSCGQFTRMLDISSGAVRVLCDLESEEGSQEVGHGPFAFAPDGRWVTGGYPGEYAYHCWEIGSADDPRFGGLSILPRGIAEFGFDHLRAIAFSPDGRFVASCSENGEFEVRGYSGREFSPIIDDGESESCSAFTFSPDSGTMALSLLSGTLVFRDTRSWKRLPLRSPQLRPWEEAILLRYTSDACLVILTTIGRAPTIRPTLYLRRTSSLHLWDLAAGKRTHTTDFPVGVHVGTLSPDGRYLAYLTYGPRCEIHFWDIEAWRSAGRLAWDPEDALNDLAFSPRGPMLATISAGGVVKLWPWRLLLQLPDSDGSES
jgi:WD40 repeat protein